MSSVENFASGIWACIPDQNDTDWVINTANSPKTEEPCGDLGPLIKQMLDKGVPPESIARFAKIIGYETAFGICYLLEDPQAAPDIDDEVSWGLFQTDVGTDEPIEAMNGAHELLLSLDPSGNEMRPEIAA